MLCFGYLCINVFVLYAILLIFRGWGVYQPVVRWGSFSLLVCMVSLGGFPVRGSFCNLVYLVSCVRRSFSVAL